MNTPDEPGQVGVERRYDDQHHVLFAQGDFTLCFDSYLEHAKRWGVAPDPLCEVMMRQGLAAIALHLSCRPRDEQSGWTFNFKEPALNIFLAGKAHASTVTGRVFTEDVKTFDDSRLFVQVSRPGQDRAETVINFTGLDMLHIFEEYYQRSEQNPARFFEYDDGTFLMALGLPQFDPVWLAGLDREQARQHMASLGKLLDSRSYRFDCGCSTERMRDVVQLVYAEDPEGLFGGEPHIEVQCPRCGHHWVLTRDDMEAGIEGDAGGE